MLRQLFLLLLLACFSFDAGAGRKKIKMLTSRGKIVLELYNETPLHRNNFIRLTKKRFYDSVLFHRVISGFMIQAGDPESKAAIAGKLYGSGGLNYRIPAEFQPKLFHQRGALAAARDNNPEKASSSCQFYIVQGKVFTETELDQLEQSRLNGKKIPVEQRTVYKTQGGTPHLDQNYTVFGRVIVGMEVVDAISGVQRDVNNRPLEDIRILKMRVLRKWLFF
jgi:peptidyl-prolyl cis-trans isomerase B (cyclophilin B)